MGNPADGSQTDVPGISLPMAVYVWEDEILDMLPGLGERHYESINAITFHARSTSKFYGDYDAVDGS